VGEKEDAVKAPRKLTAAALAAGALALGGAFASLGAASDPGLVLSDVPTANTRSEGFAPASKLSPELSQTIVAQGATKLENPDEFTSYYGYDNDVVNAAGEPQMLPTAAVANEATKTEPDKNTYLVFPKGLPGADPKYGYGTEFLFQGHELGAGGRGYLTRINLDADAAHRVTLLADKDVNGNPLATIDGSTYDPWAGKLLLTTENEGAPTYAASVDTVPSQVTDVSGALGRGGYEGIQDDSAGNIWIVEDVGGKAKEGTTAKRPNSFLFRYVPAKPGDLAHGKLQALRVYDEANQPITFASQEAMNNAGQVALHSYGKSFKTEWVTVHDTSKDGNAPFNANTLAKAANATPFKRPENGLFQPGSGFTKFYFDETGDTNNTSPENATAGGWGDIMVLSQSSPSANTGSIHVFYKGNEAHTGLDNVAWLSANQISFVEDAGDGLHQQRNALDSAYVWDTEVDYSKPANQPIRWLAEGRDASATIDAANGGFGHNEGDNEITGLHVSAGGTTNKGILGAKVPNLRSPQWHMFYTQQHGDNRTYEVTVDG
jgi:hypothetical protein